MRPYKAPFDIRCAFAGVARPNELSATEHAECGGDHKAKLGQGFLENIEVRGAAIDEVRMDDWDVYGDNNKLKKHAVG